MIFVFEEQIKKYRDLMKFPVVTCNCEFEGDPNHKRAATKRMLIEMQTTNPNVKGNLLKACEEVFDVVAKKRAMEKDMKDDEL